MCVTTDVTGGTWVASSSTSSGISTQVGPAGADLGQRPRVGQQAGDLGGLADDRGALGDIDGTALLIVELVQHALAQTEAGARHLAGDDEQWDTGRVCLLQSAQRRQRAGPGGQEQHADLARRPRVPVGLERRVVLHPRTDEPQIAAPYRVEQSERMLARDAEDMRNPQRGQRFHDHVATVADMLSHRRSPRVAAPAATRGRRPHAMPRHR